MESTFYITSESVSKGHPDKIADQISDAILDAHLKEDPHSHVACEVLITKNHLIIAGEISSKAQVDYKDLSKNFVGKDVGIEVFIHQQSKEISDGVEKGAGDQGIMYGFACTETKELMPLPIMLAHLLIKERDDLEKKLRYLLPDAKTQVTIAYNAKLKPLYVDNVIISTQHTKNTCLSLIQKDMREMANRVIPAHLITDKTRFFINPSGSFEVGGKDADTGVTGRKIIVDSYGGSAKVGGGCFSGKDPSKMDRSGAYMARYIAKNIVAAKLATRCEIQIAFAIGIESPISLNIETFGTSTYSNKELLSIINEIFDLTSKGIIKKLNLLRPIYLNTAIGGHFGREDQNFPWEKADQIDAILELAAQQKK
jgi:S-adenosylmethionine synthetase